MICLICNKSESVSFRADYKLEIKSDKKFFENQKIYSCKECDFSFVNPMPKDDKINYFYKNIYRSVNRPPYWMTENYDDIKNTYLDSIRNQENCGPQWQSPKKDCCKIAMKI